MNSWIALLILGVGQAQANPLDGRWTLVRLEIDGKAVDVGRPGIDVRDGRLMFQAPDLILELGPDQRVRRWDPRPPAPPTTCCPYSPKESARKFGDPVFSPGPDQWVVEPVVGNVIKVPPMPCWIVPAFELGPLGVYLVTEGRLAVQLLPPDRATGPSLLLVLEKALPQPKKLR